MADITDELASSISNPSIVASFVPGEGCLAEDSSCEKFGRVITCGGTDGLTPG
jgi:hypothetical protein